MNNEFITVIGDFDYENVKAECPYCGELNIFNRASDLKTTKRLSTKVVNCFSCSRTFVVDGDLINPAYQLMYFKAKYHFSNKEYMQAIITLCTTYEMFFSFILRIFLTIKPLKGLECYLQIKENRKLNEILDTKIENYTFNNLLNQVIKLFIYLNSNTIASCEDAINYINSMDYKKIATKEDIQQLKDDMLKSQFMRLYYMYKDKSLIDNIRNKVVHKQGYRPSEVEVEQEINNAHNIIFTILDILDLRTVDDDVITYFMLRKE